MDFGGYHVFVMLKLRAVDHTVMVGVEHIEEAHKVDRELGQSQLAIMIGIRPGKPVSRRISRLDRRMEGFS